ncbi:DUF2752 domain-containing protein [Pedobacter glucosidilyticus]|uniref:DUF2752 domain-containing protein n=1 Tax=Pedobacter glucosidilyticus TaxID=1122941 RepID=UPI0003FE8651|nr:DUF2752 domain-containing protein [Pedobacter glucosidilyticus]
MIKKIVKIPLELLFFSTAIIALYFLNPSQEHHSICPLAYFEIGFCPGCGLGRSIYYLLHFQFSASWKMHPLGFFAFFVIIVRIYTLIRKTYFSEP